MDMTDPDDLLHSVASPTDMVARCGFVFTLDKPVHNLNATPGGVCHECAVLSYVAAENRYLETFELLCAAQTRIEQLERALDGLLRQVNNIEVLGEWEALEINSGLCKSLRPKVEAAIECARAALDQPKTGGDL